MILKKLKRTSFKKSKDVMISGLVEYIYASTDEHGQERLLWSGARNFLAATAAGKKVEMISLASESVHSKMPVTHWIMSWQENEQPSYEQLEDAVNVFLERMGLVGHQVMYALHGNTANLHLHIVVNRMHPDSLKVVQPHRGFDIEEAHRIVAMLEHRQGWASENFPRYTIDENGEIIRSPRNTVVKPQAKAEAFESATGEKSAQRIAQERGHSVIKNATSWCELHKGMATAGLRFEKKGSGAVVFVGEVAVKASSIDRTFGMAKLCKRLGDYESGSYALDMQPQEPEPVSEIASAEWLEYRRLCAQNVMERRKAQTKRAAALHRVADAQREHRQKALVPLTRHGLSVLNIARHYLGIGQRTALHRYRADMPKPEKALPRFRTWLSEREPGLAALFKYRRRVSPGMKAERREFPKVSELPSPYRAYRRLVEKSFVEPMDDSRCDAIVAMRMRVAGYSRQETANELYRQARPLRSESENRDWIAYVRRVIWYAYGMAGDIDIANFHPTPEKIIAFHHEAEKLESKHEQMEKRCKEESEQEVPSTPKIRMR